MGKDIQKMLDYKLAVIIPCWNCAKYLRELLDCIVAQDFNDYKVFFVDDHSTDETPSILKEYSEKYPRIRYSIRDRGPKGAQTCRNIGFDLSEGAEYVMWFDGDDAIAPYCFRQRVKFMESHKDIDFGVFLAKTFKESVSEIPMTIFGYRFSRMDDLRRFLRRNLPFVVWNNIYRREAIVKYKLEWDERILSLQDSDFNIQSILKGCRYDYCDECRIDYYYRIGGTCSTSQKIFTREHKRSHLYFIDKLYYSLTNNQRMDFKLEMDDYLFFFIDRFYYDKAFIFALLNRKWVRKRPLFCLKVLIYCLLKKRGKARLFPDLCTYRKDDDNAILQFHKTVLEKKMMIKH